MCCQTPEQLTCSHSLLTATRHNVSHSQDIVLQLVELGYDSDREGYAALATSAYECQGCDLKVAQPELVVRVTLSLMDDAGTRGDLWTKPPLVQTLVARPGTEWGEEDSPERRAVERALNEWIGRRYKVTINIQSGTIYVIKLDAVDEPTKKRRTA